MMPVLLVVLLLVSAAGLAVAAVHMLAGLAWSMIAGAVVLVAFAALLRMGMTPNG